MRARKVLIAWLAFAVPHAAMLAAAYLWWRNDPGSETMRGVYVVLLSLPAFLLPLRQWSPGITDMQTMLTCAALNYVALFALIYLAIALFNRD